VNIMRRRWKAAKQTAKVDGLRSLFDGGILAEVFAREDMGAVKEYIETSEEKEELSRSGRANVESHVDWAWGHFGRPKGSKTDPRAVPKPKGKAFNTKINPDADSETIFKQLAPVGAALTPRGKGNFVLTYEGAYVQSVSWSERMRHGVSPVAVCVRHAWDACELAWNTGMPAWVAEECRKLHDHQKANVPQP
jgi:hypothetical protein